MISIQIKGFVLSLLMGLMAVPALAFDINPFKKYDGSRQLALKDASAAGIVSSIILNPVHEELSVKSLLLTKTRKLPGYSQIDDEMIDQVIRGVRWNDDPLHFLTDYPYEWLANFERSSQLAGRMSKDFDLFYRCHHYDLQFLHAMASSDEEPARLTQIKVLAWIEFTYKVATGEIPIHTQFFRLKAYLSRSAFQVFKAHLINDGLRLRWTPAYLFSLSCYRQVVLPDQYGPLDCSKTSWLPPKEKVRNIALGSLLHVVQDSFSDSHVTRNPTHQDRISFIHDRSSVVTFNAYNKQSFNLHRGADSYPKDIEEAIPLAVKGYNLEDVSAELISEILSARAQNRKSAGWPATHIKLKNGVFKLLTHLTRT